ncbi:MAG TPA: TonB-dependent siderophore receptor [Candidatus Polarisedimenticolia bacterium]|nr:TonB-dependent siderophore receptor [Candidatus Polarisedimenticolia bacterium]
MENVRRILPSILLALAASTGATPAVDAEADDSAQSGAVAAPTQPTSTVIVEATPPYLPTSNTILTRLPLSLRLTPANIGVVEGALLRDQYALVLGDALTNVSGLNVQTQSGVTDFFSIRGFDSLTSALVLTDGAPEPEVTFYHMYNVEKVEVLKGPGGFLYGSNPMAGAVNIVRKQPLPGDFAAGGLHFGSFGTWDASVDYNVAPGDGGFLFRLNSVWRESDFYRDDKENRNVAVNPAFTFRIGDRTSLNVNLEYVETEYEPDNGVPIVGGRIADVPRTRSYQSPFDFSDQQVGRAQIDLETNFARWTLRNKTYARGLDWKSDGTLLVGVFPNQMTGRPEVNRVLTLLDNDQQYVGNRFEAVLSAKTGSVSHKLLTGLDAYRYGSDFTLDVALLPAIDLTAPDETASRPLVFDPTQSNAGDSRSVVLAPYVIDQITFSERFHALLGARLDVIDYEDEVSGVSREDSEVSPMAGLVFTPTGSLSFYANSGRSFSPPSDRLRQSAQHLPEKSRQYEVGARYERPGGKFQATLAAYHMERENIAIPDDNGFTQQAGDQRCRGVELELAAEPRPRLRTFLSYAFNDAELTRFTERVPVGFDPMTFMPIFATLDRSGNTPSFAPEHILNFWVSQKFENGFGVGGGARYLSDQYIAEDNAFAIDEYVTVDAAVYYTTGPWDLSLNFWNLTDREYETRGFGSTSVIPAAPFSVFGGVQYRF